MSERDDATDLLGAFADYVDTPGETRTVKIATVQTVSTTCRVTLLFDGETVVGGKVYPCLKSYPGTVGDRVIVAPVGSTTSWIVYGAIG